MAHWCYLLTHTVVLSGPTQRLGLAPGRSLLAEPLWMWVIGPGQAEGHLSNRHLLTPSLAWLTDPFPTIQALGEAGRVREHREGRKFSASWGAVDPEGVGLSGGAGAKARISWRPARERRTVSETLLL